MSDTNDTDGGVEPEWDEAPVTLNLVEQIVEAHPDYTLTSHVGPDGRRYTLLQFFDEKPNHDASAEFVSWVSDLEAAEADHTQEGDHAGE